VTECRFDSDRPHQSFQYVSQLERVPAENVLQEFVGAVAESTSQNHELRAMPFRITPYWQLQSSVRMQLYFPLIDG
jgi:hypothetical protein